MNKLYIEGDKKLNGNVIISGSKNAALPILFMTILTEKKIKISNVPKLRDINIAIQLLKSLGAQIKYKKKNLYIDTSSIKIHSPPYDLTKQIRASIWMLAPLLIRFGKAKIFLPGGCKIGARPIDLHIKGLIALGAKIILEKNYISASIKKPLTGKRIYIEKISVGATITVMSAATLAQGTTIIENAAQEPEIIDTAKFLNTLGANIIGAGSNRIFIKGVLTLIGGKHKIIPDRIETGTFLIAAAISKGYIICHDTEPKYLKNVLMKLSESGAEIKTGKDWIQLDMRGKKPKSINISTSPYPGFPTDMQPQFALLNSISQSKGTITENIFENRFIYTSELIKMGAKIKIKNNSIVCKGVPNLYSQNVFSNDLRGSATLVLAGCIARGTTTVDNIHHFERGYEAFSEKLNKLGANIKYI
ncbi:UDP-N-acetylglucosamine 1-carboxyvinyltransferase [Buchnera aphidicola]|jgi:UDP-N-acetylglucosamine 1-carboxyvinyltransferase|uniref:UDP-N-acetylglucosamine 1-carboxyvinyltransferase n=1 Tax=Buchnera aphidicola subsp. Schizaphis graminum (strain Sg) TaxID=198804 RepID=MURA_BUCAP|nr:UDP-N-acetylglucosamine 1-carboxyvinyltransferase [Buchnera aphidicola]Q8K9G4.1 RecName: Full=UDP-N-acetylglucosamine 1-carboxyvinyltransferase; AltName: Full=Enoylpyruvate transferase; AltName: Full=UDP-N-acetylglucosamine enolpyruvyl transferase; Short=EPT [Buchnera aphidicola str. Sg (Schizaphis graminum)]AAM67925.1 UDP-N-acetylglucosamine 1-carboxyvinyltransferase [Buchnera aphidicola str. Sg (Schizaphis graminum)]AWI49582.1 UDP-N-acetylglucosamine 1-carboxyvinyltransferase [Buchnera aphi